MELINGSVDKVSARNFLKHPATSTELHLRMPPRVIRKENNNMCNKQAANSQPLFEHL